MYNADVSMELIILINFVVTVEARCHQPHDFLPLPTSPLYKYILNTIHEEANLLALITDNTMFHKCLQGKNYTTY